MLIQFLLADYKCFKYALSFSGTDIQYVVCSSSFGSLIDRTFVHYPLTVRMGKNRTKQYTEFILWLFSTLCLLLDLEADLTEARAGNQYES